MIKLEVSECNIHLLLDCLTWILSTPALTDWLLYRLLSLCLLASNHCLFFVLWDDMSSTWFSIRTDTLNIFVAHFIILRRAVEIYISLALSASSAIFSIFCISSFSSINLVIIFWLFSNQSAVFSSIFTKANKCYKSLNIYNNITINMNNRIHWLMINDTVLLGNILPRWWNEEHLLSTSW